MIVTNLLRFKKESGKGIITTRNNVPLIEFAGPYYYGKEGYCLFTGSTCTTPYKKEFKTTSNGSNMILLEGKTADYNIPDYGDDMDSLDQYFLDNKVRNDNKVQCLMYVTENPVTPYVAFCPGLVTSINGEILGYLKTHVADQQGKVVFEIPNNTTKTYSFNKTSVKSGNKYTFTNVTGEVIINSGEGSFNLYASVPSATKTFRVKNLCDYFDYVLAAGVTRNDVESVLSYLSEVDENGVPVNFPLTSLELFADAVKNITPAIYKVPAAFVPVSSYERKLMVNVAGMAANQFNTFSN